MRLLHGRRRWSNRLRLRCKPWRVAILPTRGLGFETHTVRLSDDRTGRALHVMTDDDCGVVGPEFFELTAFAFKPSSAHQCQSLSVTLPRVALWILAMTLAFGVRFLIRHLLTLLKETRIFLANSFDVMSFAVR